MVLDFCPEGVQRVSILRVSRGCPQGVHRVSRGCPFVDFDFRFSISIFDYRFSIFDFEFRVRFSISFFDFDFIGFSWFWIGFCPEGVQRVSTGCPQGVQRVSTGCPEGVQRVSISISIYDFLFRFSIIDFRF